MKRTTIRLDDELLYQAKEVARETGQTLTHLISESLTEKISRIRQPKKPSDQPPLPTFRGDGLRPGVSLDNNHQLLDLIDSFDEDP